MMLSAFPKIALHPCPMEEWKDIEQYQVTGKEYRKRNYTQVLQQKGTFSLSTQVASQLCSHLSVRQGAYVKARGP